MELDINTTRETFDDLFDRLIGTLAEEKDLRAASAGPLQLIDVRDRLHTLRSGLAAVRQDLSTAWITPGFASNSNEPECDCHEIAADHQWESRYWAA
jgi:hypothetical protein